MGRGAINMMDAGKLMFRKEAVREVKVPIKGTVLY